MENKTYTWEGLNYLFMESSDVPDVKKAYNNAKKQVGLLLAADDVSDTKDYPLMLINDYCHWYNIYFNKDGSIKFFGLPKAIEEAVYRQRERYYLREDIVNEIVSQLDLKSDEPLGVDEGSIQEMMDTYMDSADCNIPYNTTIENVVREGLAKWEKDREVAE